MAMLKIAVGCDPNAASAKAALMQYLGQKGFLLTDFGSDDPIYANVAIKVAEAVSRKEYDRGILICGTGLGVTGRDLSLLRVYSRVRISAKDRSNCRL